MSPRAIAATLPKITKATLQKHGRAYGTIVAEWQAIVGTSVADSSLPEKLAGGVLTVRVAGGAAMELQHRMPQVLERINSYVGTRAVERLRLVQAPVGRRARPRLPPAEPPPDPRIESEVSGVADDDLRRSLSRFGRRLTPRPKSEK
jgi:hypothetical protein